MLVMVVFFIAFRWIHLSPPLIRLFLLVLILLLMPTLNFLPVWFALSLLRFRLNQIKQLIRNGRSASLQRTFKKSFTSFSHSTRNKTRDGLIRVRNIRALNGRFN